MYGGGDGRTGGRRETLWSTMPWVHNLRCQGCSEAKHRSIYHRADVRQRSSLYWGGWAEEIQEKEEEAAESAPAAPAAAEGGEDSVEDAGARRRRAAGVKRYRLRWLRLCETCARIRTEMVGEWKALQLRLKCGEEARLRAQATAAVPPSTVSQHTLIVAGPLAGKHAAARALAEQDDLGDQGQGMGWGVQPGAKLPGIRPGQAVTERYRTQRPGSGFKSFMMPSNLKEFSSG